MAEPCGVCGRALGAKGHRKLGLSYDCVKLGYEREKARADATEALYADSETARMVARNAELTNALAAARRECEELKTLLREVRPLVHETFLASGPMDERAWERFLGRMDRVLAAPAAGEEGER